MEENISDRIVAKFKSIIQRIGTAFRQERTRELFTFFGVCSPFVDILVYARAE